MTVRISDPGAVPITPQDFQSTAILSYSIKALVPILYMQESGEDHLVKSQGRIYILNGIRDTVHRLESPSTLEELLEQMKNRKGYFHRQRLIDHLDLKWSEIDPQAIDTCSGEYKSYHPKVFPQVSDVVMPPVKESCIRRIW